MAKVKKKSKRKSAAAKRKASPRRWSRRVMQTSDALGKSDPYRSAMSMLTFHMNRAGNKLPAERKRVLTKAKDELRQLYGKTG